MQVLLFPASTATRRKRRMRKARGIHSFVYSQMTYSEVNRLRRSEMPYSRTGRVELAQIQQYRPINQHFTVQDLIKCCVEGLVLNQLLIAQSATARWNCWIRMQENSRRQDTKTACKQNSAQVRFSPQHTQFVSNNNGVSYVIQTLEIPDALRAVVHHQTTNRCLWNIACCVEVSASAFSFLAV